MFPVGTKKIGNEMGKKNFLQNFVFFDKKPIILT